MVGMGMRYGDSTRMWYVDMGLAALAAPVKLPIREAPVQHPKPA